MIKRLLQSSAVLIFIVALAIAVIAYGRGFRFNFKKNVITSNGILSASSFPDKASIWIDGKLISATNTSLTLSPASYNVKIDKEGYQPWENKINIRGEVVNQIDALLIPKNPSLKALTVTGIIKPTLSPGGLKIAYIVPLNESNNNTPSSLKTGVWLLELKTTALGSYVDPKPLFLRGATFDWNNASLRWSPDEKQILLTFFTKKKNKLSVSLVYLLSSENQNNLPLNITSSYETTLSDWNIQQFEKDQIASSILPESIKQLLSISSSSLSYSADDTKLLYSATASALLQKVIDPPLIGSNSTVETRKTEKGNYYVYDLKEDKNFLVTSQKNLTSSDAIHWYTDSKHILTIENNSINITDYDGTNKRIVYSGPFEDNFIIPWPGGNKILILTNLNKPQGTPNLYEIDLR